MAKEKIQQAVTELITRAGFKPESISVTYEEPSHTLWFSVISGEARFLLGREGEALGAINHLATKVAEKILAGTEDRLRVVVDANDFERKKIESLKTVAHMMAERARYFKSSIDVDPMNAHERRIIHEFIGAMPDMKTESVGEGKNRHIVIKYVDTKI
jgi:spoIIIJ-associated protein